MKEVLLDAMTWLFLLLSAATLGRIFLGPTVQDRLLALGVMASLILGVLVVLGVRQGRALYLDVALVYDIFGFLGLLAAAHFLKKRNGAPPQ